MEIKKAGEGLLDRLRKLAAEEKVSSDGVSPVLKLIRTDSYERLIAKARLKGFYHYLKSVALDRERISPLLNLLEKKPRIVVIGGSSKSGKTFSAFYSVLHLLKEARAWNDRTFWAFCVKDSELFSPFRDETVFAYLSDCYRRVPVLVVDGIETNSLSKEANSFYRILLSERAGTFREGSFYPYLLTIVTLNGVEEPEFLESLNYRYLELDVGFFDDDYKPALDEFNPVNQGL